MQSSRREHFCCLISRIENIHRPPFNILLFFKQLHQRFHKIPPLDEAPITMMMSTTSPPIQNRPDASSEPLLFACSSSWFRGRFRSCFWLFFGAAPPRSISRRLPSFELFCDAFCAPTAAALCGPEPCGGAARCLFGAAVRLSSLFTAVFGKLGEDDALSDS